MKIETFNREGEVSSVVGYDSPRLSIQPRLRHANATQIAGQACGL
jgi:hypothetical protein